MKQQAISVSINQYAHVFNEYEKQKNFNFNRGWTDYYNVLNIDADLKIEYA